jgi:FtsP/CotA-like multicopper oxidase with cupredoxin domain
MGTLWYHDHRFDFTSQNVYKGLASMYLLFSERDSGDETNPLAVPLPGGEFDRSHPLAFRLPSGDYDVPIVFADKVFDEDKLLFFDLFNLDGILGDRFTANGVIQPFFKVQRRKYRFRLLNAGPSRFYQFFLTNVSDLSRTPQMVQIANDGNLLPKPLIVQSVRISVAERMDIVVDFSKTNIGDQIYLLNRLKQTSGIGPDDTLETPGTPIIRFDVDGDPPTPDLSQIPPAFYDLPPIPVEALNPSRPADRTWDFVRLNGAWAVNGKFFDPDEIRADPKQGTWETWDLRNLSGGWQHPIHIHFEEFQILTRNGVPPPASEISRKDVVRIAKLNAGESVRVFMRFRDFLGRFPMHCHNTVHEDHAMMIRWQIVP